MRRLMYEPHYSTMSLSARLVVDGILAVHCIRIAFVAELCLEPLFIFLQVSMSIDEQLEVIERTFVDANTPLEELVHPTKAGVTAVKQWHLYPDFALWENEYVSAERTSASRCSAGRRSKV